MAITVNPGESVEAAYAATPHNGTLTLKKGVHSLKPTTPYLSINDRSLTIEFEDGAVLDGKRTNLKAFEIYRGDVRIFNFHIRGFLEDGIYLHAGGGAGIVLDSFLIEDIGAGVGPHPWGGTMTKQHWGIYMAACGTSTSPCQVSDGIIRDVRNGFFQTYSGVVHIRMKNMDLYRCGNKAAVQFPVFPAGANDGRYPILIYSGLGSFELTNFLIHDSEGAWADVRQACLFKDGRYWNVGPWVGTAATVTNVTLGPGGFVTPATPGPGGSVTPSPPPPPLPTTDPLVKLGRDVRVFHTALSSSGKTSVGGRLAETIAKSLGQ